MARRNRTHWTDAENYDLAHIFADNGFVRLGSDHSDVIAFAERWGRNPTAVEHHVWLYDQKDPGYTQKPNVMFGWRIVQTLRTLRGQRSAAA